MESILWMPNIYMIYDIWYIYDIYDMDANIRAEGKTGQGFNENISLIKTSWVSFPSQIVENS